MREPQSPGCECRWGNHPTEKTDRDNNAGHRRDASDALSQCQPALLADPTGPMQVPTAWKTGEGYTRMARITMEMCTPSPVSRLRFQDIVQIAGR